MLSNDPGSPPLTWLNADTGYLKRDENGNPLTNSIGRGAVSVSGTQGGGMKNNKLSWRPGKHLAEYPNASQFAGNDGMIPENVVFFEVEYAADGDLHKDYQRQAWEYGTNEKGDYNNTLGGLPYIPKDSYYIYRTNQIADGATPMIITGAYRITRALTDAEARQLNEAEGGKWVPRRGGELTEEGLREMGLDEAGLEKMRDEFDYSTIEESHDESEDARRLPGYVRNPINFDNENLRHAAQENGQNLEDYSEGYKAPVAERKFSVINVADRIHKGVDKLAKEISSDRSDKPDDKLVIKLSKVKPEDRKVLLNAISEESNGRQEDLASRAESILNIMPVRIDSKPITREDFGDKIKNHNGDVIIKDDGMHVGFSTRSLEKVYNNVTSDLGVANSFIELLEQSKYAYSQPHNNTGMERKDGSVHPERENALEYRNYVNKFTNDNGTYYCRFTVMRDVDGDNMSHGAVVSEIKLSKENTTDNVADGVNQSSKLTSAIPNKTRWSSGFTFRDDAKLQNFFEYANTGKQKFSGDEYYLPLKVEKSGKYSVRSFSANRNKGAIDEYERRMRNRGSQVREALQDSMHSLKVLMQSVVGGKKKNIEDFSGSVAHLFNIRTRENAQHEKQIWRFIKKIVNSPRKSTTTYETTYYHRFGTNSHCIYHKQCIDAANALSLRQRHHQNQRIADERASERTQIKRAVGRVLCETAAGHTVCRPHA